MLKLYLIALLWGISQAAKLGASQTADVDIEVRTDLAVLVNTSMADVSDRVTALVNQCNNSVNAAITYCGNNCQGSGGGGDAATQAMEAILQKLAPGFNKIEGGINKAKTGIVTEFNKFKDTVKKITSEKTWKNIGSTVLDRLKEGTSKALSGLKTVTGEIGSKAKEWSNTVGNWFKDTFKIRRRKRAAALSCDLCTTMSTGSSEDVLNAVCGTDVSMNIAVLTQSLEKMLTLMTSISTDPLVTEINTDQTKVTYGVGPTGEFQVMTPIESVLYTVNGTPHTVNGTTTTDEGTYKTVNIMKTSDIADEVLTLVDDHYFAV
nr:uncharacterized protein LOC105342423 [Crassostrea gigas]